MSDAVAGFFLFCGSELDGMRKKTSENVSLPASKALSNLASGLKFMQFSKSEDTIGLLMHTLPLQMKLDVNYHTGIYIFFHSYKR